MNLIISSLFLSLISGCASVETTVDSYGDDSIKRSSTLYFFTDYKTMEEKQIASIYKNAAIEEKKSVSENPCAGCTTVLVFGQLGGSATLIGSYTANQISYSNGSYTTNNSGVRNYSGYTSAPVTETYSYITHDRLLKVLFYNGNKTKEVRSITARSTGTLNSLTAVAKQMCLSIFTDFPNDINGESYSKSIK